jgi:hypothetical protein
MSCSNWDNDTCLEYREVTCVGECEAGTCLACEEEWSCSEWTECRDGIQTRYCRDLNDCGTTIQRPPSERQCEEEVSRSIFEILGISPKNFFLIFGILILVIVASAYYYYFFHYKLQRRKRRLMALTKKEEESSKESKPSTSKPGRSRRAFGKRKRRSRR